MRLTSAIAACAFLILQACERQKLPDPSDSEPLFSFEGNVGGQDYKLSAGKEAYYQFSDFVPPGGGWPFSWQGYLKKTDCDACAPSVLVRFFDTQIRDNPNEQDAFYALSPGTRITRFTEVRNGSSKQGTRLILHAVPPAAVTDISYKWIFSDGTTVFSPTATHQIGQSGNESVILVASKTGFNNDTLVNQIFFADPSNACMVGFQYVRIGGNSFRLIGETGFSNYVWEINGMTYNVRTIDVSLSGQEKADVSLRASRNNCTSVFSRKIPVLDNFPYAIADMEIKMEPVAIPTDSLVVPLGQVEIHWTNSSGISYSSTRRNRHPETSTFEIQSTTGYELNEAGRKTIKLELKFDGYLFREDSPSDSIKMSTKRWVTAVAIP